nr:hypothetical protein [Ensifer aridi]
MSTAKVTRQKALEAICDAGPSRETVMAYLRKKYSRPRSCGACPYRACQTEISKIVSGLTLQRLRNRGGALSQPEFR